METEKNNVPVTGEMLAEKARQALKEGWGYIWGTRGRFGPRQPSAPPQENKP